MDSSNKTADHLVVLIHGLWGNPSHLGYLETSLRKAYAEDQLDILLVKSNASNLTYDGIELGGERITHEVEGRIKDLEDKGTHIKKISIVGYSLGGLLARYAIGLLYANGWFDRIQPVNFTTFASPHLGVRTPLLGTKGYIWNVLGASTLGTSGRQMFLIDNFRETGRPLLSILADPTSIFMRGLSLFKHKSLYANIINDKSVVYHTASISRNDPFVDTSAVDMNPIPGTEGVILDPTNPVRAKNLKATTLWDRLTLSSSNTLKSAPFFLLLCVMLPIGSIVFLTNAGIQSFRSAKRVALHESGQAGIGIERYRRMPPLVEEAKHAMGKAVRSMGPPRGEEEFLLVEPAEVPTPTEEEEESGEPDDLEGGGMSKASSTTQVDASEEDDDDVALAKKDAAAAVSGQHQGTETFPTLALTEAQFEMIENLNAIGIVKYPVHITAVRHTHAAIIVRSTRRPGFGQGKIVVRHWIDNFEI